MSDSKAKAIANTTAIEFAFLSERIDTFGPEYVKAVTEAAEAERAWSGTFHAALAAGEVTGKNEAERLGNAIVKFHDQFVHKCAVEVKLKEAQANMEILKLQIRLAEDRGQLADLVNDLYG